MLKHAQISHMASHAHTHKHTHTHTHSHCGAHRHRHEGIVKYNAYAALAQSQSHSSHKKIARNMLIMRCERALTAKYYTNTCIYIQIYIYI